MIRVMADRGARTATGQPNFAHARCALLHYAGRTRLPVSRRVALAVAIPEDRPIPRRALASPPSPACRLLRFECATRRYDFPAPWWDNVSEDAKTLVKQLLELDPKRRLTAEQVRTSDALVAGFISSSRMPPRIRAMARARQVKEQHWIQNALPRELTGAKTQLKKCVAAHKLSPATHQPASALEAAAQSTLCDRTHPGVTGSRKGGVADRRRLVMSCQVQRVTQAAQSSARHHRAAANGEGAQRLEAKAGGRELERGGLELIRRSRSWEVGGRLVADDGTHLVAVHAAVLSTDSGGLLMRAWSRGREIAKGLRLLCV